MAIEVVNRQRLVPVNRGRLVELASAVLAAIGPGSGISPDAGISLAFVREPAIRELNRAHRGKDAPADVLSFPAGHEKGCGDRRGARYLGDVVVSTDTAVRQARRAGLSLERELSELAIHGILHLCGYDHETDRGEMNRLELKLRRKLLD